LTWQRPFLILAAAFNAAWVVLLVAAPEQVFATVPPFSRVFAALVGAEGLCFALCAVRSVPWLLATSIAGKALGPFVFAAGVSLGYLRLAQWPLTIVNDVVWIPPLLAIWRRRATS
jgi:hypothetical protein